MESDPHVQVIKMLSESIKAQFLNIARCPGLAHPVRHVVFGPHSIRESCQICKVCLFQVTLGSDRLRPLKPVITGYLLAV